VLQSEESWISSVLKLAMSPTKNETARPKHVATTLSQPRDPLRYKRVLRIKLNQKFRHTKKLKYQDETLQRRMRRAINKCKILTLLIYNRF
jgi:hypothetical protein